MIGVMLTVYKRPHLLARQLDAIKAQTAEVSELCCFWNEGGSGPAFDDARRILKREQIAVLEARPQVGVWMRFWASQMFDSPWICVLDDDTVPGRNWLSNCLETARTHEGLLGTIGVIVNPSPRDDEPRWLHKVGWCSQNESVEEVDLVGHSWVFKREWLREFCAETRLGGMTCGEDHHFSFALQKRLGLGTYVPPHPAGDKSLWGSLEGMALGSDSVALWKQPNEELLKREMHRQYMAAGWRPMALRGCVV